MDLGGSGGTYGTVSLTSLALASCSRFPHTWETTCTAPEPAWGQVSLACPGHVSCL